MNKYKGELIRLLLDESEVGVILCGTSRGPEEFGVKGEFPSVIGMIASIIEQVASRANVSPMDVLDVLNEGIQKGMAAYEEDRKAINSLLCDTDIEEIPKC